MSIDNLNREIGEESCKVGRHLERMREERMPDKEVPIRR